MRLHDFLSSFFATALVGTVAAAEPAIAPPPAPEPAVVPVPVVAPEDALAGRALAEALRAGGLVLFMRHAEQVPAPIDADCGQHLLTPVGDDQARQVGAGMRRLGVPVGEVLTSPVCRCRQTAVGLGLGEPRLEPGLAPPAPRTDTGPARMRLLGTMPPPGRNTVLVSHQQGSRNPEHRVVLGLADIIAFRPQPDGTTKPIARITPADWDALATAMGR